MIPSFHYLQLVVLNKHPDTYTYGNVSAFYCEELDAVLVKHVVACPGDTVLIITPSNPEVSDQQVGGILLVNGEVSSVYCADVIFEYAGLAGEPLVLGAEEYFVIGDNVAKSRDSRYKEVGVVNRECVLGRVVKCAK